MAVTESKVGSNKRLSRRPRPAKAKNTPSVEDPKETAAEQEATEVDTGPAKSMATFAWALLAGGLIWASLPPIWFWPLAIAALIPLTYLVQVPTLPGRRPFPQIWLASLLTNLLIYQFVRLPHWAAYFGWGALALYLSVYLPAFVGTARLLVHRFHFSPLVAVPLTWLGIDWLRGHLFSGFAVGQLAHSFTNVPVVIQVADLFGDYGLSAIIAFWGACIAYGLGLGSDGRTWRASAVALTLMAISLAGVIGYGNWRLYSPVDSDLPTARVAIVQGSVDTIFPNSQQEADTYWSAIEKQYMEGTQVALEAADDLDLILWPESKFTRLDVLPPSDRTLAPSEQLRWEHQQIEFEAFALRNQGLIDRAAIAEWVSQRSTEEPLTLREFREWTADRRERFVPMLVGCQTANYEKDVFRNAAIHIDGEAQVKDRYFKMHLVMFGEYIPGADLLPFLYQLGPVNAGLEAGDRPQTIAAGGLKFAPSVCFETTVPRVIRRHVATLAKQDQEPDVLVNVTDDGWFWGSAALDMHLASNVFRAVENRKPLLVAANTGLSTVISGRGRIMQSGPRRDEAVLMTEIAPETLSSPYQVIGDWPAAIAGWFVAAVMLVGVGMWGRQRFTADDDAE